VLKPGEFIANLAIGATGNCQVNRLMNVIFNNYKILLEKGIINEEVYKSLIEGTFIFDAKVMLHKTKMLRQKTREISMQAKSVESVGSYLNLNLC
jgi:hypothetical protein